MDPKQEKYLKIFQAEADEQEVDLGVRRRDEQDGGDHDVQFAAGTEAGAAAHGAVAHGG